MLTTYCICVQYVVHTLNGPVDPLRAIKYLEKFMEEDSIEWSPYCIPTLESRQLQLRIRISPTVLETRIWALVHVFDLTFVYIRNCHEQKQCSNSIPFCEECSMLHPSFRGFCRRALIAVLCSKYQRSLSLFFLVGATTGLASGLASSSPSASSVQSHALSPALKMSSNKDNMVNTVSLKSQCSCGKSSIHISIPEKISDNEDEKILAADCHCPVCRKFHIAAHGTYLYVPIESVHLGDTDALKVYSETCGEIGPVERLFCKYCFSKMATRPVPAQGENNPPKILVNMGGLIDDTIPDGYKKAWRKGRLVWQPSSQASWTKARPSGRYPNGMPSLETTKGSCACGRCQYEMTHRPVELQHCYCKLCRQLCGSAFMTWIPVDNKDMKWTTTPGPELRRTTNHGQRHFCTTCGGALTIVYDEQPDLTWPAAGGLNDESIPSTREEMSQSLYRACHICCIWKQSWYSIPNDGLERIQYAG